MKPAYDTLSLATNGLKARGFDHDFDIKDGRLYCLTEDRYFDKDSIKTIEMHRFEGMTNPSDNSVVYAIEADNMKGILVDAYGTYSTPADIEVLKSLRVDPDYSNV